MPGVKCREYEMALMDLARRRPVDAPTRAGLAVHVESCARCRHLLDSQIRLSAAAGAVTDEASRWNAPFRVEQAVMAEVRSVRVPRRRRVVYGLAGAAIAASLMLVWAVNRSAPSPRMAKSVRAPMIVAPPVEEVSKTFPLGPVVRQAVHRKAAPARPAEQPFIAIPYTMPLEPYERADVVRVDLPVTALIAAGVPVGVTDPSARAETDVLVGQDGRARAVRLVSISMVSYQR
jgi:hypothetical protein